MELGYLPEEAAQYRKTFFTCFDIESLENLENVEDMKNVVATHKIVSIAVSTNHGHSRCFVRNDSSHGAVLNMFEEFLDFLQQINLDYELTIPRYFHDCIEQLEIATNDESTLLKRDKMELGMLKSHLNNYLIQDVFGFNSGKFFLT